jgi:tetratricopeptide (TPR) repeat protein
MVIEIGVNTFKAKLAALTAALAVCALLALAALTNLVIGALTDERINPSKALLAEGAKYAPNSAPLQARLAEAEMAADERDLSSIEARALRAANLSPWDYNYRLLLASVKEARGDRAGAETALRAALELAPNNAAVRWQFANILLRQGKLAASLEEFNKAVSADSSYLPSTLDLVWRVSGGRLDAINSLAGDKPKTKLLLAKFLLSQSRLAEAGSVFNSIDPKARLALAESGSFIDALMAKEELTLARYSWVSAVSANNPAESASPSLIWNGGFESDVLKGLAQFDWAIYRNEYARPSIDSGSAHSGSRALRVEFAGRDTTRLDGEIKQLVIPRPGARYRLECFVKTDALVTPEGPRVVVTNAASQADIAASDPIASGSSDWRRIEIDFVAPQAVRALAIKIKRVPRFSYDDPTKGVVWFDDFILTEQDTKK